MLIIEFLYQTICFPYVRKQQLYDALCIFIFEIKIYSSLKLYFPFLILPNKSSLA